MSWLRNPAEIMAITEASFQALPLARSAHHGLECIQL